MSVYKRTVRGKRARNYSIDYQDENGTQRTVSSGTSDKRLAEQIKRKLVDRVRAILEGLVDPTQERLREEADKPLRLHVQDYVAACRARGDASKSLEEKERALNWFLDAVGKRSLAAIRADEVDARLGAETEAGASARTVNLKLEAASAFLNWCVRNGRLAANPLRVIQKRNQVIDRRRPRRVLTGDEARRLIAIARRQAAEVPGAETRPLWYLFPLLAGLRRGDMMRMRWADLDFAGNPPTLTIRGGKARKRVDVLPLHADLVLELHSVRPRAALPSAAVFPTAVTHATRRTDFERAKVLGQTEDGYADLHSLRHTYGTRLAERGVAPATLQRLMRHASIQMTMGYYVHLDTAALHGGLNLLPGVEGATDGPEAEAL
jgi:integrase/recombinase XerD